jgi:tRNA dimethylallyltransferase
MKEVTIVTGATASGKSALALQWAGERTSVIINADSMQLYRGAPILTAQPSAADMQVAEHRLYGVLDASDAGSVAAWLSLACAEITAAWEAGIVPIVTGGTGMYLHALMHGLSPIPEIPVAIRTEVRALDNAALQQALMGEDPMMAATLRPSDSQRMARALEVMRATGQSLQQWQHVAPIPPLSGALFNVHVLMPNRTELYERINQRTYIMIQSGGMMEAEVLHTRDLSRSLPLMRAVGVVELLAYLDGHGTLAEAITAIQTNTRHYAKRQLTWIRNHYADATWIDHPITIP